MRELAGIEVGSTNSSTDSTNDGENNDDSNHSGRGGLSIDGDHTLLSSVGEVGVTRRHVVVGSSLVETNNTSIEVGSSSVEFSAVGLIVVDVILVVVVLRQELFNSGAVGLSNEGHVVREIGCLEELVSGIELLLSHGQVAVEARGLDDVGSISSWNTLSGVVLGVVVRTSPLEVNVVTLSGDEVVGNVVVLSSGEGLDNVSSLTTDVQVVDVGISRDSSWALSNVEHVGSVLEGTSVLVGVKSHLEIITLVLLYWVSGHGGVSTVLGRVIKAPVVGVGSRDVVTNAESTVALTIGSTRLGRGDGPVVVGSLTIHGVTEMIITRVLSKLAIGGSNSVSGGSRPYSSCRCASSLRDGLEVSSGSGGTLAEVLGGNVLGLLGEEVAQVSRGREDGNILPWRWTPYTKKVRNISGSIQNMFGGVL